VEAARKQPDKSSSGALPITTPGTAAPSASLISSAAAAASTETPLIQEKLFTLGVADLVSFLDILRVNFTWCWKQKNCTKQNPKINAHWNFHISTGFGDLRNSAAQSP
jgi:hypothetical protein